MLLSWLFGTRTQGTRSQLSTSANYSSKVLRKSKVYSIIVEQHVFFVCNYIIMNYRRGHDHLPTKTEQCWWQIPQNDQQHLSITSHASKICLINDTWVIKAFTYSLGCLPHPVTLEHEGFLTIPFKACKISIPGVGSVPTFIHQNNSHMFGTEFRSSSLEHGSEIWSW